MKRTLALTVVGCVALAGCTGGGSKPAASSSTAGAPTTSVSAAPTGAAAPAVSTSPGAVAATSVANASSPGPAPGASSPVPSTLSAPSPSPPPPVPTGAVTAAQAAAVERHFDAVAEASYETNKATGVAAAETCSTGQGELADLAGRRSANRQSGFTPGFSKDTALGWVQPEGAAYPQQFLYEERYVQAKQHFDAKSMNVFTRASAAAPWKICLYPNLYSGVPLPAFATVAKNVVPAQSAKTASAAAHALGTLATYLTERSAAKIAQPAGLTVPFGACPTATPSCNPPGYADPYFPPFVRVADRYRASVSKDPVFTYPLRDGGTLVIGSLLTTDRNTALDSSYLQQDATRSAWNVLVPPGEYHSVTVNDVVDVVLELSPAGAARLIGSEDHDLSAATTPR